jgi:hypothetical protein
VVKRCPGCGAWKATDAFPRNRRTKDGYAVYCKPCHNARGRETRDRLYGGSRHYHLTRRYGIGAKDVERLIAEQGDVCAICKRPDPEHVDHDHADGAVRGVLCFNCNGGLGQFRDDVEFLSAAIEYLQRPRNPPPGQQRLL